MAQGKSSQDVLRVLYDVTRDAIGLVIPETCPVCGCSGTLCRDCKDDLQQPPVRFSPRAALRAAVDLRSVLRCEETSHFVGQRTGQW